ncbi:transposase [Ochrobactrum sp. Marseille-Q0166]|nr:transposase [Ochrobactrum sp. Marseille-Q0166]
MNADRMDSLELWLQPFLASLSHRARRRMFPLYIAGRIAPGDRKSVQPLAPRTDDVAYNQPHHFVAVGVWDSSPLEAGLLKVDFPFKSGGLLLDKTDRRLRMEAARIYRRFQARNRSGFNHE